MRMDLPLPSPLRVEYRFPLISSGSPRISLTRTKSPVFVLGAGFTKAFVPTAPLLTSDYDGEVLRKRFRGFGRASQVLETEMSQHPQGWINLERLMTRLDGGLPYDSFLGGEGELRLLFGELKSIFGAKLAAAKEEGVLVTELASFANHVVSAGVNCNLLQLRRCSRPSPVGSAKG
jgi:hypothetical protein